MARGHRTRASSLFALTLGALVLFLIANTSELIRIRLRGAEIATTVPMAIVSAWNDGSPVVAALAAVTAVIAPALFIGLRLYLLVPLLFGRLPRGVGLCLRVLHTASHWNTVSVMAVGALLSLVRMADLAQAEPGPGLVALGALGLVLAAIETSGLRHLWPPAGEDRLERDADHERDQRWLGCECCGWVGPFPASDGKESGTALPHCARCGHALEHSQAIGLQRTWALLAASAVALVPANLLPMMSTIAALRSTPHTLLGGIAELWFDRAWGLAALVFVASIMVPILKIGALALLAWSVSFAPLWHPLERARLYRLVEAVGHWSMLDVYVVLLLVGMVRFGNLAGAAAGPALLAFASVVVLTMLATHSFDPRWIWQPAAARLPASRVPGPLPTSPA